jgi:hypothetical protein
MSQPVQSNTAILGRGSDFGRRTRYFQQLACCACVAEAAICIVRIGPPNSKLNGTVSQLLVNCSSRLAFLVQATSTVTARVPAAIATCSKAIPA